MKNCETELEQIQRFYDERAAALERIHEVNKTLIEAFRKAEALLSTQLNEANSAVTPIPHPQYEPGPILTALRDALNLAGR
jgi:hypothetical protein